MASEPQTARAPRPGHPRRLLPALLALRRLAHERDEIARALTVIRRVLADVASSQLPRMAAALAFRTLFSLIPVLVLSLVVFQTFVDEQQIDQGIQEFLRFAGVLDIDEALQQQTDTLAPMGPQMPAADPEASLTLAPPLAPESATLSGAIRDLANRAKDGLRSIEFGFVGVVSVLVFVYAALTLLIEAERAFNQIYRARAGRRWATRLTMYWTVLTLGTLFIAATFYVGSEFQAQAGRLILGLSGGDSLQGWGRAAVSFLGFLVTVGISTLLLVIAYCTVPNARVQLRAALIGALVASVAWEASKWGFRLYLTSGGYSRLYGQLALIPLAMLWIYLTWLIILSGLQVTYALNHFRSWSEEHEDLRPLKLVDPVVVLAIAVDAVHRFSLGRPLAASDVADRFDLPHAVASRLLRKLTDASVLRRVADSGDDSYALAREPSSVLATDLMALVAPREPDAPLLRSLHRQRMDRVAGWTLADLAHQFLPHQLPGRTHPADPDSPTDQPDHLHEADPAHAPTDRHEPDRADAPRTEHADLTPPMESARQRP